MLVHRPSLHPMARAALMEIQAAGVEVTPEVVLWVQDAASRIAKTPPRPVADLVDWPIPAGGVLLYPLTFGAAAWLMRLPERMRYDVRVIAYACAHGRTPAVLVGEQSLLKITAAVARWALRLTCSMDALGAAVDVVLGCETHVDVPDAVPRKREPESVEWGAVVRALCSKYPGTTPSYWTWDVSREQCYAMIQQINAELPDDARITDYEVESNAAFRSVVEHIKRGSSAPVEVPNG